MARTHSLPDCRPLLAEPDDMSLLFRPVVDLARGSVAGYQALARFPGTAGPDVWFAAAADAGLAAEVEALFVHKALDRLPWLPTGCCLVVPVRAALLADERVREAFDSRPQLDGLVVEVVADVADLDGLRRTAADLRSRGAQLALAGDAPLLATLLAPEGIVIPRDGLGPSGVRAVPGAPWVLTDGLETPQDLAAALSGGAALARGWLFGVPSSSFDLLAPATAELVRTHGARIRLADPVLALLRPVHRVPASAAGTAPAVEVDDDGVAVALLVSGPGGTTWRRPVSLAVLPDAPIGETLKQALLRPGEHRHDPVLCTDEDGRPLGVVHVAELTRAVR
jgi:EAL domain-containing protein (putative c-di-GMP-specific phosphodiesterase class I)